MVVTKVEEDKRKENNLKDFTTKFKNDFSKEIYEQTYKFGDEDIDKTLYRVAKDLASIEEDPEKWTYNFLDLLTDFKFVPGGRITSNAGTSLKGTSMINCFVDGFLGEDQDSMESILDALRRQALILKSEGGYGFCADVMRPRGSYINGIGNESPGAVKMLDMWDTQSSVITEGSGKKSQRKDGKVKIRKGAQMVTMSCFSNTTEVLTNEGWLNIIDVINKVNNGEELYAIVKNGDSKKIFDPIIREPEPIYEIETEDGEVIKVTADHQFEVKNIITDQIYLKKICEVDFETEYLCIIEVI